MWRLWFSAASYFMFVLGGHPSLKWLDGRGCGVGCSGAEQTGRLYSGVFPRREPHEGACFRWQNFTEAESTAYVQKHSSNLHNTYTVPTSPHFSPPLWYPSCAGLMILLPQSTSVRVTVLYHQVWFLLFFWYCGSNSWPRTCQSRCLHCLAKPVTLVLTFKFSSSYLQNRKVTLLPLVERKVHQVAS